MDYSIRVGEEKDFESLLTLIQELADFEKQPEMVVNSVSQMQEEKELFQFFVAENNKGEIIASAVYFIAYYTWVGKSLYLDDLYVKPSQRKKGVGKKLIEEVFKIAIKENCNRVRWQVLDWNENAIAYYKKLGATLDNGWVNCDFTQAQIINYFTRLEE